MRSVSKWCLCFRPPATIEINDGVDCSADRMLSLIAAARSGNRLNKKKKKSPKTKTPDPSVSDHHSPPRTLRRSFSSVVRAVIFETSLRRSRSVREARSRNRPDETVTAPPPSDKKPSDTSDQEAVRRESAIKIAVDSETDPNQIVEVSCAPAASDCRSRSVTENTKRSEILMNPVVCLVLLSLCVTVFWGRVCAVMMTTVWIYAWQSGAVVIGLGEMLKLRRKLKKKRSGGGMEAGEMEKVTDRYSAKGNELIGRGLRWN